LVLHSPQKAWARLLPLAAVLMYNLGVPVIFTFSTGVGATALKGAPEKIWQSAQWQAMILLGSISAVNEIAPQWHWPVMFIFTPK
jgi:hypothetical protein